MKLVKNAGSSIPKPLECSALTSDQVHDLIRRYRRTRADRERWYVDWNLLDAFKEIWKLGNQEEKSEELVKSAKDKTLTKQFYHDTQTNENLDHYFDESISRPSLRWNINVRVAHTLLRSILNIQKLSPIKLSLDMDVTRIWSNKKASAGAIGCGSKETNETACLEAAFRLKGMISEGKPFDDIWIPAVAFHRAQLGNLTKVVDGRVEYSYEGVMKDRFIWGLDGGTVTVEAQYAKPLIDHLTRYWYGYSGGDSSEKLRSKIRECRIGKYWISADFSKFDQTIQPWVIEDVFSIIKEFFDFQYHQELDWICHNFINTHVVYSGGRIAQKHRGIPSGSNFTQVVGSMCNALMMLTYISSRAGRDVSFKERCDYVERELAVQTFILNDSGKHSMFVMGDDNLMFTRTKIDIEVLSKYVHRVFGVTIHPDKTDSGGHCDYPTYLKRIWYSDGEYREPIELAINVCHPERNREYDTYSCWHIMYGLYLVYTKAFTGTINERFLIKKMNEHGGIERLLSLNPNDLPGSLRAMGNSVGKYLYSHAKSLLGEAA